MTPSSLTGQALSPNTQDGLRVSQGSYLTVGQPKGVSALTRFGGMPYAQDTNAYGSTMQIDGIQQQHRAGLGQQYQIQSKQQAQTPGRVQYSLPAICTSEQMLSQRPGFTPQQQQQLQQSKFGLTGNGQEPYQDQNFLDPEADMFGGSDEMGFGSAQEEALFPIDSSSSSSSLNTGSGANTGTYGYMLTSPMNTEEMSQIDSGSSTLLDIQMNRFGEISLEDNSAGMFGSVSQMTQFPLTQGKDGKSYAIETWKQYFGDVNHCTWNDFKRFVTEKNSVDKDVLDKLKELFCYKGLKDVVDCTRWVMFVLLFHSEYFDNDPRPILSFNEALDLLGK